MSPFALALVLAALSPSDWPWWRGPYRDGVSRETEWDSKGKAEALWRRDVGHGQSCPSIVDGRLYTLGHDADSERDVLWCLDAASGEIHWRFDAPGELVPDQHAGGTLTTPAIDRDRVFVTHRSGEVRCHAAEDGELLWRARIDAPDSVETERWGVAGSPLVFDDMVVANVFSTVALDPSNGRLLWRSRPFKAIYSTPQEWSHDGTSSLAIFCQAGLVVLDRGSGAHRFFHPWRRKDPRVNATTPIVIDQHRIFISSGYGHGATLLDFSGETPAPVWETRAMNNVLVSCVLVDGFLYGFDEAVLKCLGLDGVERWRERGIGMGSLSAAGDRLIVLSADGELIIAAASPAGYRELSRKEAIPGANNWSSPVLADGLIYCRNGYGDMACFDHRAE